MRFMFILTTFKLPFIFINRFCLVNLACYFVYGWYATDNAFSVWNSYAFEIYSPDLECLHVVNSFFNLSQVGGGDYLQNSVRINNCINECI